MSTDTRTSIEIAAEIAATKKRRAEIGQRLAQLDIERRDLANECAAIDGNYSRTGVLEGLARDLADARRREADANRPRVRVMLYGECEHVVSRVTPKRIYTREPGSDRETIWTREGLREGRWTQDHRILDMDKIASTPTPPAAPGEE